VPRASSGQNLPFGPHPNMGNKQKRGARNNNKRQRRDGNNELLSYYKNISFQERTSTGQPGSPHRYFEDSFDVLFHDSQRDGDCRSQLEDALSQEPASFTPKTLQPTDNEDLHSNIAENTAQKQTGGNQVVHRHLNGLCIVTAGDVLEKIIGSNNHTIQKGSDVSQSNHEQKIGISSIQYLVKVGKDCQSAKGKLRTKNKKQKRSVGLENKLDSERSNENDVREHDGNVLPHDPLCQVILSNGTKVQLNCCVAGTVIELNHRLDANRMGLGGKEGSMQNTNGDDVHNNMTEEGLSNRKGSVAGGPSLILNEPLLDGHLAVIIPTKGSFPPRTSLG